MTELVRCLGSGKCKPPFVELASHPVLHRAGLSLILASDGAKSSTQGFVNGTNHGALALVLPRDLFSHGLQSFLLKEEFQTERFLRHGIKLCHQVHKPAIPRLTAS